jgi:AcrR family transcriptional regulator
MPSTPRGLRTEAAFEDAARKVFAERGFFNAKITDIAEAAGKSPGSFYNYYESKEMLLEVLADRFSAEVLERVSHVTPSASPEEVIEEAVRIYVRTYREYLPEVIGVFQLSMVDERFAERWRQNRMRGIHGVLDGIKRARKEGFAKDLNAEILASAIVSTLESFCWVWLATGGDDTLTGITEEEAVKTLAAVWYRALYFPASVK